ncbi:MAG: hypothetical protein M3290_04515 [Actinomycetota bacterium]|nr:hypothetical protein [Actinomycetota bacterium]
MKQPVWSPDHKKITYATGSYGRATLWTINADGTGVHRLTRSKHFAMPASWAPGGNRLVAQGRFGLVILGANGKHRHSLVETVSATAQCPQWSSDGHRIVYFDYSSSLTGESSIFTVRPDGSRQRQVTDGSSFDYNAVWSPNGRRILFGRDTNNAGLLSSSQISLFTVRPNGTHVKELTDLGDGENAWKWGWSPDGREIVYTKTTDDGGSAHASIWVMRANGSHPIEVASDVPFDDNLVPSWSPDGKKIVFGTQNDAAIGVADADGSGWKRLNGPGARAADSPAWYSRAESCPVPR